MKSTHCPSDELCLTGLFMTSYGNRNMDLTGIRCSGLSPFLSMRPLLYVTFWLRQESPRLEEQEVSPKHACLYTFILSLYILQFIFLQDCLFKCHDRLFILFLVYNVPDHRKGGNLHIFPIQRDQFLPNPESSEFLIHRVLKKGWENMQERTPLYQRKTSTDFLLKQLKNKCNPLPPFTSFFLFSSSRASCT